MDAPTRPESCTTIASYDRDGRLSGIYLADALPDVEVVADGLRRSLEELAAATPPLLAR